MNVATDFKPQLEAGKNAARAPRFPLLQSSAQRLYSGISALPGVGKVLKSPVVAKTLQSAYHRLNTKARKYEPLAPQERLKWEAYYAADQKELSELTAGSSGLGESGSMRGSAHNRWPGLSLRTQAQHRVRYGALVRNFVGQRYKKRKEETISGGTNTATE